MQRVPMVFPGQASQFVGMAADLGEGDGPGAGFLRQVNGILGYDLVRLMRDGPLEVLTETRHAQPAIFAHAVAVALELRARGLGPSVTAGHSLGEYAAAVAAGALSPEEGLRLVQRRGELMFAAGRRRPGTMAAVLGLSAAKVQEVCAEVARDAGVVVLANHNSADQAAISGEVEAVAAAGPALLAAGAKRVIPLTVSGAFHSPLLAEAAEEFAGALASAPLADPEAALLANVSAQPVRRAGELRNCLARQLTAPVLWHATMESIAAGAGQPPPRLVLEVGPGKILSNLARRAHPEITFLAVGARADLDRALDSARQALA